MDVAALGALNIMGEDIASKTEEPLSKKRVIGAVLGLVAALAVWLLLQMGNTGLSQQGVVCLAVLAWAIVWWVAGVLPDFVTALLMTVGFMLLGGMSATTVFSAFTSETWWLLLAAFSMGAAMKSAGLMRRMALAIIRKLPNSFAAHAGGLIAVGTVVGPFVPSMAAKVSMLGPIAMSLGDAAGYQRKGKQMTGLFMAMFTGVRTVAPAVISASVIGYALLGLLPQETQAQFDMLHWFIAALPWFLVVSILNYAALVLLYGPHKAAASGASAANGKSGAGAAGTADAANVDERRAASAGAMGGAGNVCGSSDAEVLRASSSVGSATQQDGALDPALEDLGPMSPQEKKLLVIVLLTVLMWATQPLHGIGATTVALVALVLIMAFGILTPASFKSGVNWTSLLFIGIVIGLASTFNQAGISDWIVTMAGPLFQSLASNSLVFVLGVALLTLALRFVIVSQIAYLNIVMAFMVPLVLAQGISPWVAGFAMYAMVDPWFVLYQNPCYLAAYYSVDGQMCSQGAAAAYCGLYSVFCLLGLAVSVPLWTSMGLLG